MSLDILRCLNISKNPEVVWGNFSPQVFVISTSLSLKAASTLRKMRLFAECRMPLFMARHQPSSIYIHTFGIEPAPSRPFSPAAGWHWSTLQAHSRIADELVATRVIQAVAKQHLVDPSTAKMFTRKQPHPDRSKSSSQIQRQRPRSSKGKLPAAILWRVLCTVRV